MDTELCDASSAETMQFKQSGGTNRQFTCLASPEEERNELVHSRLPSSKRTGLCCIEQQDKGMAH